MSDMKPVLLLCVAAIALAACTKDELADDTRLSEGQYPLQIAAVTLSVEGGEAQPWGAPQTRVSESTGSKWNGGEKIGVQIDGKDEVGTYAVQTDGTVSSDAPLYWSDTGEHTVTAWYPATNDPLDLSDQDTDGLAYLLHGTGTGPCLPAARHGHGRLPDPGDADLHPLVGKGARHALGCHRRQ